MEASQAVLLASVMLQPPVGGGAAFVVRESRNHQCLGQFCAALGSCP